MFDVRVAMSVAGTVLLLPLLLLLAGCGAPSFLITPEEIVTRMVDRTGKGAKQALIAMVMSRAESVLQGPEAVYLVMQQRSYDLVRDSLPEGTRCLALVQDGRNPDKDWIVVSNARNAARP